MRVQKRNKKDTAQLAEFTYSENLFVVKRSGRSDGFKVKAPPRHMSTPLLASASGGGRGTAVTRNEYPRPPPHVPHSAPSSK